MSTASDASSVLSVPTDELAAMEAARVPLGPLLWRGWKAYTRRAARYQSTFLLSLVYYLVLGPTSIIARLVGAHLLDLNFTPRQSYWRARPLAPTTLDAMRRQY